jgi:hypothetical protein
MRPGARGRPADECPYRRPFPADFDGCAAYHPAYFIPLTTGYDSMSPVWTCSNLVPGAVPSSAARFYGRCRIGDEAARVAWIDTLHAKRLSGLRTLSRELTDATAALTGELMAAKGAQLQAPSETPERDAATLRLQHLADRWLAHLDTFLRRHGAGPGSSRPTAARRTSPRARCASSPRTCGCCSSPTPTCPCGAPRISRRERSGRRPGRAVRRPGRGRRPRCGRRAGCGRSRHELRP